VIGFAQLVPGFKKSIVTVEFMMTEKKQYQTRREIFLKIKIPGSFVIVWSSVNYLKVVQTNDRNRNRLVPRY